MEHFRENRSAAMNRATPLWLDAFLVTVLAHLALAVHLRLTGESAMAADWLMLPRELWWWIIFFLPGYFILLLVAFLTRPHQAGPLAIGAFFFYIALATAMPRFSS